MNKKKLTIHSENILPIIKKWLYSEKDIFLRELVSNACDAITKVKILQVTDDFRIDISLDEKNKTLSISDNGIGMTYEEVEKYIAQIAFSGAEEFFQTYQKKEEIIGHFGLGFYSSYMVADKVSLETLSYQEGAKAVIWSCDGSSEYEIAEGEKTTRGTNITLHLNDEEYLQEDKVRKILQRFCSFMPFPIFLNGKKINEKEPLWIKPPKECTEKEYLDFYQTLYPLEQPPIFWIHLQIDVPFHLQGILYFPKITKQFDFQQSHVKLFCNRVFVSDHCKDILPDYLTILKGAIDSPDIPLNVSRSYLQTDRTVKQLGNHIAKKIADKLHAIFKEDKEKYLQLWPDIEHIIKLGILQDESFYNKIKDILYWKKSDGSYVTLPEYLNDKKTVYYSSTEEKSDLTELYKEKGIDILVVSSFMDAPLMSFLESKEDITFQRVDSSIDASLLDPSKEKSLLDAEGKSEAGHMAQFVRDALDKKDLEVEAKSLATDGTAAFFVIDEGQRRMQDYLMLTQGTAPNMGKRTFVINTNNPLIQKAYTLKQKHPDLSKKIMQQLHDFALVSQKQYDVNAISDLCSRSKQIMEELTLLV